MDQVIEVLFSVDPYTYGSLTRVNWLVGIAEEHILRMDLRMGLDLKLAKYGSSRLNPAFFEPCKGDIAKRWVLTHR